MITSVCLSRTINAANDKTIVSKRVKLSHGFSIIDPTAVAPQTLGMLVLRYTT